MGYTRIESLCCGTANLSVLSKDSHLRVPIVHLGFVSCWLCQLLSTMQAMLETAPNDLELGSVRREVRLNLHHT